MDPAWIQRPPAGRREALGDIRLLVASEELFISFFKIFFIIYLTLFYVIGVKVSDPLELELQTAVSCHVGAGN